jgi:hypothetical protein
VAYFRKIRPDLSSFTRPFGQFPFMLIAVNSMNPWLIGTGESHVSIMEAELQLEVEDLARTKWMTGTGLRSCNPQSWIEWLADDVVLSLRLGAVDTSHIGERHGYSGMFRVAGKKQSRRLLTSISVDLKKNLSITTEIISGSHIILLGKFSLRKPQSGASHMPVVVDMTLNPGKKIQDMAIAIVDMQTMATAMGIQ